MSLSVPGSGSGCDAGSPVVVVDDDVGALASSPLLAVDVVVVDPLFDAHGRPTARAVPPTGLGRHRRRKRPLPSTSPPSCWHACGV